MKKVTIITVILLLVASAAVFAQQRGGGFRGKGDCLAGNAGPGMRGQGNGQGGMLLAFADELELTEAQIKSIQDLNFKHREAMIDIRANLKKVRLNEQKEMMTGNPDKDKILFFTREINKIEGQIAEMRVEHQFAVHSVLTDEQNTKLMELRKNRPGQGPDDERGPGRGNRDGRGRGFFNDDDNTTLGMRLRDGSCVSGR
ncbi:MAG: hypothetical protein R3F48_07430 [Candidatus Zixiibacteriota bacterium]